MVNDLTRRRLLQATGAGAAICGLTSAALGQNAVIQGFEKAEHDPKSSKGWRPVSDRKIRVGLVGYGYCKFGAAFGFQDHPNVEVVAVSDLVPARCEGLAQATRCKKTFSSLEELVKDDSIEAVFVATDAPSHAKHCITALQHGKHVASAVPACFGSIEEGEQLLEAVKVASGLVYMMFETSYFREDLYAMRQLYRAGRLGKVIYAEGEYYHYKGEPIDSYLGWRTGLPPQWYPTHATAYYTGVTDGSFTEVSCVGVQSVVPHLTPENNCYQNPFGTEIALFRTSDGGAARMAVSWDSPGYSGEMGRVRGQKGSYYGKFHGDPGQPLPNLKRPPLPPQVEGGAHGGSHGYLTDEFITAILESRRPLIDIVHSLNMTAAGIVAHSSAVKGGELMKIPQFAL